MRKDVDNDHITTEESAYNDKSNATNVQHTREFSLESRKTLFLDDIYMDKSKSVKIKIK